MKPLPVEHVLCNLESPAPHRLVPGARNRFTGIALDLRGGPIGRVSAVLDGKVVAETSVDRESPEIGRGLPGVAGAGRCRWVIELDLPSSASRLAFEAVLSDGAIHELFAVDLAWLRENRERLLSMARSIDALPLPPPEIVALTQGHGDADAYRESILPGVQNARRYLEASGFDWHSLRAILDFGCGSGRLLAGLHAEDSSRELFGCDVHPALTSWARENLPRSITVLDSSLRPPLPLPDCRIDLLLAVSVFTHLRLETQRLWAAEFRRLLKPGGGLLVTLHGEAYARLLDAESLAALKRDGVLERSGGSEGSNLFATFHTGDFASRLFEGFEPAGYFPSGRIAGKRVLFPLASLQDVAVFLKRS